MSAYVDPKHLADAPERARRAIVDGDIACLLETPGFGEFIAGESLTRHEIIESYYAFTLSDGFACLKSSFLISMIRAAAPATGVLSEALMRTVVPAIVCAIDVWTRATDGSNPVTAYVPAAVFPIEQVAGEFAISFRTVLDSDAFDEALEDNERYYREHTLEGAAIDVIRAGQSTYEDWIDVMRTMEPFSSMSDADCRQAYDALVKRVTEPTTTAYRDMVRESLQRRVSLRKCTAKIRQLQEIIERISSAASVGNDAQRRSRPETTPARVQSPAAHRNRRAVWNKPVTASIAN